MSLKTAGILLAVCWFSGSVYAGYRLTEDSFGWIEGVNAESAGTTSETPKKPPIDLESLKGLTEEELKERAKELSPKQFLCLRSSIASGRIQAVLAGEMTVEEEAAIRICLE